VSALVFDSSAKFISVFKELILEENQTYKPPHKAPNRVNPTVAIPVQIANDSSAEEFISLRLALASSELSWGTDMILSV
jgi:hypothetical protein